MCLCDDFESGDDVQSVQHEIREVELVAGGRAIVLSPMDVLRFTERLAPRDSGCIEWTGYGSRTGGKYGYKYGMFRVNGRPLYAHRVAYTLAHGPIPPGFVVMHSCDNGLCCNPAHLSVGTKYDNSQDMVRKGRSPRDDRHSTKRHPETVPKGQRHHWHKLSDADVVDIRRRYDAGEKISAIHQTSYLHVSPPTVERIAHRTTWRHLP